MTMMEKGISGEIKVVELAKAGDTISGIYAGKQQLGEAACHVIEIKDGDRRVIWTGADLDSKLEGEVGRKVQVTFLEKKDMGGGRTLKLFKVEVDR